MHEGVIGQFDSEDGRHHPGYGHAAFGVHQAVVAVSAAILCLAVAGCAEVRTGAPGQRQAVIDQIVAASAKVVVEQGGRQLGSGSGVVVASKAGTTYVLSAAHLVEGKEGATVFVRFAGAAAGSKKHAAAVIRQGNTETLDLALLKVPGITVPVALFPADDQVRIGEEILVVGFPWGKRLGLYGGIVSQVPAEGGEGPATDEGSEQTIVVDAASARGVSGGGVFREATGSLVGIVEGYQTASIAVKDRAQTYSVKVPMPGETFVVPLTRIRRFLKEAGLRGASDEGGKSQDRND